MLQKFRIATDASVKDAWVLNERSVVNKFNFIRYYVNFHVTSLRRYFYRLYLKIGSKYFEITMCANFNGLKLQIIFSLKNQVTQKNCCNSASKQLISSFEVSNTIYRLCNSCKVIHSETKAFGLSKLSIQIEYILFKHRARGHSGSNQSFLKTSLHFLFITFVRHLKTQPDCLFYFLFC